MNSFDSDHLKRDSIISGSSILSKDSIDSQLSIIFHRSKFDSDSFGYRIEDNPRETILNDQSKEKVSFSEELLFFGPLILCLILLISGIVVFILVEQRNNKYKNREIQLNNPFNLTRDNFMPILCPFVAPSTFVENAFALNQLNCGLHRSSVINIYYSNNPRLINPGENLTIEDVIHPPIIELNKEFLSKVNSKSFVLILIDPEFIPNVVPNIILHWIRYFPSSSLEDEEDICYYKLVKIGHLLTSQKIVLLYATNSTKMMIKGKTFCNQMSDWFRLTEYITFIKLKLIGSTHFFIPYVTAPDD